MNPKDSILLAVGETYGKVKQGEVSVFQESEGFNFISRSETYGNVY